MTDLVWEDPPRVLTVLEELHRRVDTWARVYGGLTRPVADQKANQLIELDGQVRVALGPMNDDPAKWGVWAKYVPAVDLRTPRVDIPAPVARANELAVKEDEDAAERPETAPIATTRAQEPEPVPGPPAAPPAPSAGQAPAAPAPAWFAESGFKRRALPGQPSSVTDLDYARLAQAYVALHKAGKTPSGVMRHWFGSPEVAVIRTREARKAGMLTPAPKPRSPGGELTRKAIDLLNGKVKVPTPADIVPLAPVGPTPAQQAEIDRLNAENDAHVAKMSAPDHVSESGAHLPATCDVLTSVTSIPDALRDIAQAAWRDGWLIGKQGNGHLRWAGPKGQTVACSATPSSAGMQHTIRDLRKAGVPMAAPRPTAKPENLVKPEPRRTPEQLSAEAKRLAVMYSERFKDGLPEETPVYFHPDVLAMFGLDLEMALAVVRKPMRVEPDLTFKERSYPVLRFVRGDATAIIGLRTPSAPMAIGVYLKSNLDPSEHIVNHMGGGTGGARKVAGLPTTPKAMLKALAKMGVVVMYDPLVDKTAEVLYKDQHLGKVTVGASSKTTVQTDYQRVVRKLAAIDRRQLVS